MKKRLSSNPRNDLIFGCLQLAPLRSDNTIIWYLIFIVKCYIGDNYLNYMIDKGMIKLFGFNRTHCSRYGNVLEKPRVFNQKGFICSQCKHARAKTLYTELSNRKREGLLGKGLDSEGIRGPAELGSWKSEYKATFC